LIKLGADGASRKKEHQMNRTVSALYDTRADAERALEALRGHGLADHAEIHDQDGSDSDAGHGAQGRLHHLFGGHEDAHVYAEGIRRGHILLTTRVEDEKETLAAEIMEGGKPLDVAEREAGWRRDGWSPSDAAAQGVVPPGEGEYDSATAFGSPITVRSYVTGNAIDYSEV
jgi:hypothetical protein